LVNRPHPQQPYIMPQTSSEIEFGGRPAPSAQIFCAARPAWSIEYPRRERVYVEPMEPNPRGSMRV
jgi:hypothetical protein